MTHPTTQPASCCAEPTPHASPELAAALVDPVTVPSEKIEAPEPTRSDGVISFRISRQAIMAAALVILAVISTLEMVELWQLRRALTLWQKLPAAQNNITATPSGNGGANSLPQQVGGC